MKSIYVSIFSLSTVLFSSALFAQTRLPDIPLDQYTAEQKAAAQEFEKARKKAPWGPFAMLMYSPQLMNNARAMGDYLRYNSAFDSRLSEFAILITAREWHQDRDGGRPGRRRQEGGRAGGGAQVEHARARGGTAAAAAMLQLSCRGAAPAMCRRPTQGCC